ncbi:MAG: hypothetical protein HQL06_09080 [Nitrospirae bacterium]|nr:hypothetical protein [Nitrospirota bacterium]
MKRNHILYNTIFWVILVKDNGMSPYDRSPTTVGRKTDKFCLSCCLFPLRRLGGGHVTDRFKFHLPSSRIIPPIFRCNARGDTYRGLGMG